MEEVYLRFPHLSENIFGRLNFESLAKCKEVSRSWYQNLDNMKFLTIRANKVKGAIEIVEKLGQIQDEITFDMETRKQIIDHARKGSFFLVHIRIMESIGFLYALAGDGWTPLHHAAATGHFEVVKYIMENYDYKNPKSDGSSGETPLHCAARFGRLDVVKYIMCNVLDMNPMDKNGETPFHCAARGGKIFLLYMYLFVCF